MTTINEREVMRVVPLHDRVALRMIEREAVTAGGIVLPEATPDAALAATREAEVLAVGPAVRADLAVGDRVVLPLKTGGSVVRKDGVEVLIVREGALLAVLDARETHFPTIPAEQRLWERET